MKYRVDVRWEIAVSHGRLRSLVLVGCLPRDSVLIKIQVVTTERRKWANKDNKFAITCYL